MLHIYITNFEKNYFAKKIPDYFSAPWYRMVITEKLEIILGFFFWL